MSGRHGVKLGLATIGAVLFLVGVRRDDVGLRWVGIGWFAAAFALRFIGRRNSTSSGAPPETSGTARGTTDG